MESKNIKVIDEHGIDRVANIVCSIDIDGSDYVIYWIERDNDNDNLFISKLIKNNDGTSNMINIEDSLEKSNLNDIVKELITHAINDDNDKLSSNTVALKNGKEITISSVLFNKEQNINVQKTYITTVKKSVTKVSETYYHVAMVKNDVAFENEKAVFFEPPVIEKTEPVVVEETLIPSLDDVNNKMVEPVVSEESPTFLVSPVLNVPTQNIEEVEPTVVVESPKVESISAPFVSNASIEAVSQPEPVSPVAMPNIDARINIIGATSMPTVQTPSPIIEPTPIVVSPEPVISETPVVPIVEVPKTTENVINETSSSNELFFDGSKETNLSEAFSSVADERAKLVVDTVEPIREFGQDEPVVPLVSDVQPIVSEGENQTKSLGFANNKFFMVIAIVFFLASCVFLGYEVFKYFMMK